MTRRWFDTGYDPETDPAVLRERQMIAALREHSAALVASGRTSRPEETTAVRPAISEIDRARARSGLVAAGLMPPPNPKGARR